MQPLEKVPELDVLGNRKKVLSELLTLNRSRCVVSSAMIEMIPPPYVSVGFHGFARIDGVTLDRIPAVELSEEFKLALIKELRNLGDVYAARALKCDHDIEDLERQIISMGGTTNSEVPEL